MSAIVTAPPILINATHFSRQGSDEINPFYFDWDGASYQVLSYNDIDGFSVYKSTDNWATNAPQNEAGKPANSSDVRACYQDPITGEISILYIETGTTCRIVAFQPGPDTYGTPSDAIAFLFRTAALYRRTDGTYVALAAGANLNYFTNSAGTWSGSTAIRAGASTPGPLWYDVASKIAYLTFIDSTSPTATKLYHAQLDDSLTLNSPVLLGPCDSIIAGDIRLDAGVIEIAWTDSNQGHNSSPTNTANVAIATISATPIFTSYVLFTGVADGSDTATYARLSLDKDGNLVAFFVETDYNTGPPVVDRLWISTFTGSWGALILFYDAVSNPPTDSIGDIGQFIHTGQTPRQSADGSWIYSTAMEVIVDDVEYCAGFILKSPGASGPLALTCPIGGDTATIGVPYSKVLSATGGTPPYTYALITGPPWLSLAGDTLSGVPTTTGDLSYTVKVTDSLGAEATITCTIHSHTPQGGCVTFSLLTPEPGVPGGGGTNTCAITGPYRSLLDGSAPVTGTGGGPPTPPPPDPTPTAPTITSLSPLPGGTDGSAYSFQFAATGTAGITWSATGLPGWASLSSSGLLTGTPNTTTTVSISVTATNSVGSDTKSFSLTTVGSGVAPTITTTSPLPAGNLGGAYSFPFAASGTAAITWSATGLPSWASLSAGGVLTGIPDAMATTVIAVTATNGTGSDGPHNFSITVGPPVAPPAPPDPPPT